MRNGPYPPHSKRGAAPVLRELPPGGGDTISPVRPQYMASAML